MTWCLVIATIRLDPLPNEWLSTDSTEFCPLHRFRTDKGPRSLLSTECWGIFLRRYSRRGVSLVSRVWMGGDEPLLSRKSSALCLIVKHSEHFRIYLITLRIYINYKISPCFHTVAQNSSKLKILCDRQDGGFLRRRNVAALKQFYNSVVVAKLPKTRCHI